ncbi:hypothetical protein L2E82_22674 [Cichorium intybus]|uniref:Uncharacterized protein n=1 Tax=Cichorium intybus TaxID=13427 RepID=A0ACB9DXV7_CICIN|nr:hypothetical protein L2E82_22674 [Cichorium intybus]
MPASASVVVTLKTLFSVLACVMVATLLWAIATDGLVSCVELRARWLAVALINFYINVAFIGAWFVYKESSWIKAAILIILEIVFGSIITFGYIVMQLFKFSRDESSKDPLYFVFVRHEKRDVIERKRGPSVVTSRVIISSLGCFMLGSIIYITIVDGSPFRTQVFSPCMVGTLTDFYFNVLALSVWVAYKESSWISAFFIGTCVYIVRQLFYLSPHQHVSLVLLNNKNMDFSSSDPLLVVHADV